jgi:hypothetical protein
MAITGIGTDRDQILAYRPWRPPPLPAGASCSYASPLWRGHRRASRRPRGRDRPGIIDEILTARRLARRRRGPLQ